MPYTTLQFQPDAELATITLNRPEKRNAISPEMIQELQAALDEVESGDLRVTILTGAGKAFCAGMDLAVLQTMASLPLLAGGEAGPAGSDLVLEDARRIAQFFRRLYSFPKVLIAAVNGAALAGGCGIATLCDFTLACPEATFGYTEVRVGFMPALVAVFLTRQLGERRARDLLLSGRILTVEQAREMGLVNEVIPKEKLMGRARELAHSLAGLSPTSLTHTKRLIVDLGREELDRQLEISIQASARIRTTADFREGLTAFLEKRKPQWER
jgi:methylglutaconyl-CoA hydratase